MCVCPCHVSRARTLDFYDFFYADAHETLERGTTCRGSRDINPSRLRILAHLTHISPETIFHLHLRCDYFFKSYASLSLSLARPFPIFTSDAALGLLHAVQQVEENSADLGINRSRTDTSKKRQREREGEAGALVKNKKRLDDDTFLKKFSRRFYSLRMRLVYTSRASYIYIATKLPARSVHRTDSFKDSLGQSCGQTRAPKLFCQRCLSLDRYCSHDSSYSNVSIKSILVQPYRF